LSFAYQFHIELIKQIFIPRKRLNFCLSVFFIEKILR
jgi:hypothetical protein